MWEFQKTSTDNLDWKPGSLGAGYLLARSNTPDTFNFFDYSVRTWCIGPDETQDIDREYRRTRPTEPILFQFYISPTGGIHDGGKGFKNLTGKSSREVIAYLHRIDNRLYDGHDEIKVNRLSATEEDSVEPHFHGLTGEPCYCGFGTVNKSMKKEGSYKYKDIKKNPPKFIKELDENTGFIDYITRLAEEGAHGQPNIPGLKALVPWLIKKLKDGELKFKVGSYPYFENTQNRQEYRNTALQDWSNYINATDAPMRRGKDVMSFSVDEMDEQTLKHKEWLRELAEREEREQMAAQQDKVYRFDEPKGWYVVKMNPDGEEAEYEGLKMGCCIGDYETPYPQAIIDEDLEVYVLRDEKNRSHAIWGYNADDDSVAFMETAGKIYGRSPYIVKDPEIRNLITEANTKLGLSDDYQNGEWSESREHFRGIEEEEELELEEVELPPITNYEELVEQMDHPWDLAQQIAENEGGIIGEDTQIYPGPIQMDDIVTNHFEQHYAADDLDDLLSYIRAYSDLDDFVYEADAYLAKNRSDYPEDDPEIVEYDTWRKLHTNPNTGEYQQPKTFREEGYKKFIEGLGDTPWGHDLPEWEEFVRKYHAPYGAELPASLNPELLRPSFEEQRTRCQTCEGSGYVKVFSDSFESQICPDCNGTGFVNQPITIGPGNQPVYEEASGQTFLGKNSAWEDMSVADELKLHLSQISRKSPHSLSWVKGGKGRGLYLNDGTLVTWPVDKKGNPQHADMYEYLTGKKLPSDHSIQNFTHGIPFDIYEDGTLAFFSENIPPVTIEDLSKIDYRLKTSSLCKLADEPQGEYYHAAPASERETIQEIGLISGQPAASGNWPQLDERHQLSDQPMGVYVSRHPNAAKAFTEKWPDSHPLNQPMDIWRIPPGQIQEIWQDPMGAKGVEFFVPHDIAHVELYEPAEGIEKAAKKEFTKEDAIELLEKNNWDFNADEFFMGMNDELEHEDVTHGDPEMTAKIVADHLREHPDYYTQLRTKISKNYKNFNVHFHPGTGKPCHCYYGNKQKHFKREASQAVRKIKNQNQKALRSEEGEKILDYFHRLISGHSINEQGKFGEGKVPGLEGLMPWIIKNIKKGYLKPMFDDEGNINNFLYFASMDPEVARGKDGSLPNGDFSHIDWEDWSNWFNASNSPARRSRTTKEVGGALNRSLKWLQYMINEREREDLSTDISTSNEDLIIKMAEELKVGTGEIRDAVRAATADGVTSKSDIIDHITKELEIDVNNLTPLQVKNFSSKHKDYLREMEQRKHLIEMFAKSKDDPESILYRIKDPFYRDWTVHKIKNGEEAGMESDALGHCIGSYDQPYREAIDEGTINAYSLRDADGLPKLSWHFDPDGNLGHVQGKSTDSYNQFRHLATEFNEATAKDDDSGGEGTNDDYWANRGLTSFNLSDPTTMEDYVYQYHEPWEAAEYEADEGLADDCEIDRGSPDWAEIADNFIENGGYDKDIKSFIETLFEDGDWAVKSFTDSVNTTIEWHVEHNGEECDQCEGGGQVRMRSSDEEMMDCPKCSGTGAMADESIEPMVNFYNAWRQVHTNPITGNIEIPVWLGSEDTYMRAGGGDPNATPFTDLPYSGVAVPEHEINPTYPPTSRHLPASLNPRYFSDKEKCPVCINGRVRSSNENRWSQTICPNCQGLNYTTIGKEPVTVIPEINRNVCITCHGTGNQQDGSGNECSVCEGIGNTVLDPNMEKVNCDACNGSGKQEIGDPPNTFFTGCYKCAGQGTVWPAKNKEQQVQSFPFAPPAVATPEPPTGENLTPEQRASAWDKPAAKLSAAELEYVLKKQLWSF